MNICASIKVSCAFSPRVLPLANVLYVVNVAMMANMRHNGDYSVLHVEAKDSVLSSTGHTSNTIRIFYWGGGTSKLSHVQQFRTSIHVCTLKTHVKYLIVSKHERSWINL